MLKLFISHSSANAWLIPGLLELIRAANPQAQVFCSSEASINPGDDYNKTIYAHLKDADVFVAIVSREYWKSRYCVLELGAAYERFRFDNKNAVSIQPMLVPPLDKGMALANTPLVAMQVTDLTDADALILFLDRVASPEELRDLNGMRLRASEYAALVRKNVLKGKALLYGTHAGAYYDEPTSASIPRNEVVRFKQLGDDRFLFEFCLSRLQEVGHTPSFASLAFTCWGKINLREYLAFDRDAAFMFQVDNITNALSAITVELKYDSDHKVFQAIECPLDEGTNTVRIPLGPMNYEPLASITEISFVIHPATMRNQDGLVIIDNIGVDFAERNLFEEV